jgi:hypothetical protein
VTKRKCAVCGKDPAEGFASIWWGGKEIWYCHPDDGPSCYVAANQSFASRHNLVQTDRGL